MSGYYCLKFPGWLLHKKGVLLPLTDKARVAAPSHAAKKVMLTVKPHIDLTLQ